jgi:hypothetical protein
MDTKTPTSPVYLRGDGQSVSYLLASSRPGPVGIGAILLLDRTAEGAARIEAAHPLEVLTAILGSAYSARAAISAGALARLADDVQRARLGRLQFSDWRHGGWSRRSRHEPPPCLVTPGLCHRGRP